MDKELKIIEIIKNKDNNTADDYDKLEQLNKNIGTFYLENDIIPIEYHSPLEKYKAIQLLKILEQEKIFYQTMLKDKEKIVFSNEDNNNNKIITIDSYYYEIIINSNHILRKIFEPLEKKDLFILEKIKEKLEGKKSFVTTEEKITLLKQRILKGIKNKGLIDFFDYLDLMGSALNEDYYLKILVIDLAFNKRSFNILKRLIQTGIDEDIKTVVYHFLYEECALDLLNDQLKFQSKKINTQGKRSFLVDNLTEINQFFIDKMPEVTKKYRQIKAKEPKKITREEIIKETVEILKDIDPSNSLLKIFEENISNGKIILWDSNDTEKRKQMYQKYHKDFNIDEALCYLKINEGKLDDYVINIPLDYAIYNVSTLIHELIHLNSALRGKTTEKTEDLNEFASIYFEEYAKNRLIEKGYTKEELYHSKNERILNTCNLYIIASPTIFWLNEYQKNGNLTYEEIDKKVRERWHSVVESCKQRNYTKEQTTRALYEIGLVPNIDACTKHIIENVAENLVRYNTSIFEGYKYILGTILANEALENNIAKEKILEISNNLNNIDNPLEILKELGIDTKKYGFKEKKEEVKEQDTYKAK